MPDHVLQEKILGIVDRFGDISGDSFSEVKSEITSWGDTVVSRRAVTSALFDLVGRGQLVLRRPVIKEEYHGYGCTTLIRGYRYSRPLPAGK